MDDPAALAEIWKGVQAAPWIRDRTASRKNLSWLSTMTWAALSGSPSRTISLAVIIRRKSSRLVKGSSNTTILSEISGSRLSYDRKKASANVFLSAVIMLVNSPGETSPPDLSKAENSRPKRSKVG